VQCTFNVTSTRFSTALVAVGKQKNNTLKLCICSFCYPACKSHLFCVVLYCRLWPVWPYLNVSTLSRKR